MRRPPRRAARRCVARRLKRFQAQQAADAKRVRLYVGINELDFELAINPNVALADQLVDAMLAHAFVALFVTIDANVAEWRLASLERRKCALGAAPPHHATPAAWRARSPHRI